MKKFLATLTLLLLPCLLLAACGTATFVRYEATESTTMKVRHVYVEPETEFELSANAAETLIAIWNDGDWEPQITKTGYDYLFEFSDNSIRYVSELGLFNDPVNNRHLYVTEEQRLLINSFLD